MNDDVVEQLRGIRGDLADLRRGQEELRQRVSSIEGHLANRQRQLPSLRGDVALVHQRLDRQDERLDRVERRLDLTDAPAG